AKVRFSRPEKYLTIWLSIKRSFLIMQMKILRLNTIPHCDAPRFFAEVRAVDPNRHWATESVPTNTRFARCSPLTNIILNPSDTATAVGSHSIPSTALKKDVTTLRPRLSQ